jgi:hypothetical protein
MSAFFMVSPVPYREVNVVEQYESIMSLLGCRPVFQRLAIQALKIKTVVILEVLQLRLEHLL